MKFIDEFVAYAQEFTGCPKPFLEWSAILCLSAMAGRKHVMRRGDWDVYPNLWVLLLGRSSSYKSTGLAIAERLIRDACPDILMGQEYSTEKMLDDMAENPHRLFLYDEAETFFKMLSQHYNASMKSALMTLWRGGWYSRRTKQTTSIIKDAYLCWGGASTDVQVARHLIDKDSDLLSGMFPRFLMVPYFDEEHSIENPPPADLAKKQALIQTLSNLAVTGEREYQYSTAAMAAVGQWSRKFDERVRENDPLLGAFYRKMRDEHFHKLAMLSAFERGSVTIEMSDLQPTAARLWQIEKNLPNILEKMTTNSWGRERDRVIHLLKQAKIVSRNELGAALRIYGQHLTAHLKGLEQDGLIQVVTEEETGGRPKMLITWLGPREIRDE